MRSSEKVGRTAIIAECWSHLSENDETGTEAIHNETNITRFAR